MLGCTGTFCLGMNLQSGLGVGSVVQVTSRRLRGGPGDLLREIGTALRAELPSLSQILLFAGCLLGICLWLLPDYLRAIASGQLHHCRSNLQVLAAAVERYSADHGGHYPPRLNLLRRRGPCGTHYLQKLPTCPSAGKFTYDLVFSGESFTLRCQGGYHPRGSPLASSSAAFPCAARESIPPGTALFY